MEKYTVRVRELNSLEPDALWVSHYVMADGIDQAVTYAVLHLAADRAHCCVYRGHAPYYSPAEQIAEYTICVGDWVRSHADDETEWYRRQEAAHQAELAAMDLAQYGN